MGLATALLLTAHAQAAGHVDVTGGTQFPVTMGGGIRCEGASRLQVSAAAGAIPEAYVDTLESALGYAGMAEDIGVVADAMLTRAPYVHLGVGWRPFAERGLTLAAGHQTLWLEGAADEIEIEGYTLDADVSLASRLRLVTAELRVDRPIGEHLLVSWSLGGMKVIDADSTLSLPDGISSAELDTAVASLDTFYEDHFATPTVGLAVGYRFF